MRVELRVPYEAEIVERIEETPDIFTLRLRFCDPEVHAAYHFELGQFNMLYLHGVGEVPISIISDPEDERLYDHTIRAVGRVTRALSKLREGDRIGVRGPFGRGWPMRTALGRDVVLVTGGLGCAPVVSVINYVVQRRARFGRLVIMQGVKHSNDLIWRERYEHWSTLPDTQVLLAANEAGKSWPWATGFVTKLIDQAQFDAGRCTVMMCGPQVMMNASAAMLGERGVALTDMWLSMERNMQCAMGYCGHCQYGPQFVCRDGPVFPYPEIKPFMNARGF